jgi:ribosome-binding factor A
LIPSLELSMGKHRLERVNELLQRELGAIINREIHFPDALLTIHQVDVTPDLKHAHVYVSFIGSEKSSKQSISKLASARNHLQYLLSKRVILKYTPQIHFKLDESVVRGTRVISIMNDLDLLPEKESMDADADHPNAENA